MPIPHADLRLGSPVYSSDGKHVGSLERLLIDEEGMDLRHIVVSESPLASGHHWYQGANLLIPDVILPADSIASATEQRLDLNLSLSEVRHQHPYVSYEYVGATFGQILFSAAGGGAVWTYKETADKPAGELEIQKGENVMYRHSGEILGHVHDVVYDEGEMVGVVVRPVGPLQHDVLIQVRFLDRSDDLALFAHITKEDLHHLSASFGKVPR